MLNIFSCASWPSKSLLWRNVSLGLQPIFQLGCWFLLSSYMSCLCISEMELLLVPSFAYILFHFIDCLFLLFVVSFAVQKLASLMTLICLFWFLFQLPWETDLRKHWYDLCQRMKTKPGFKRTRREFPSGPLVRTLLPLSRHGFDPWSGN